MPPKLPLTSVRDDTDAPDMPHAPAELAGKTADEPTVVRWVANNVDVAHPDPRTCPSPFAWTLLRACRETPGFLALFLEKCWVKSIPSKAQLEAGGPKVQDGRSVIELTDRILAHSQEAQGHRDLAGPRKKPSAFEAFDPTKEES